VATKPETLFTQKVLRRLRNDLPQVWVTKIMAGSIIGIPDLVGVCGGLFFAWELKVGQNKPTRIQVYVLEQIRKAGGIGEVVTPENLETEFKRLSMAARSNQI
jgi:hypothetical protein